MKRTISPPPQDFDSWSTLARTDPQAFEDYRERIINEAILRASPQRQQRLWRMQWKLNQIRNTSRTPMVACLRMNRMLWEAVVGENGLLNRLCHTDDSRRRAATMVRPSAEIVPFRQRR